MFSGKEIKKAARLCLKGNMKEAVLATLVCALISALLCVPVPERVPLWVDAFSLVVSLVVGGITLLAWDTFFLRICYGKKPTFWEFIQGFEHFWVAAAAGVWSALWIFLWSLLFVIPGIVKAISYSMTFFALAENPRLGARKALSLSKILTRGHKADLFALSMSFLLWEILAVFTLEILQLWLAPYVAASFATAYLNLKEEALRTGNLTVADFQA